MKLRPCLVAITLVLTLGSASVAEPVLEGWEPGESLLRPVEPITLVPVQEQSLLGEILRLYQERLSSDIAPRCIFATSCSYFFMRAVDGQGLPVGLMLFIDRYMFRENMDAFQFYRLKRNWRGVYKLDDDFYLETP